MSFSHLKINNISIYFLPLATFFILISSAATNIFIILSVISSLCLCIKNSDYKILIKENFFKVSIILYFLLVLSCIYTIGDAEQIFDVLKKYIKFLYIPFLFYALYVMNNDKKIINFFITGCTFILFMSYLKYFSIIDFDSFYRFLHEINIADTKEKIINNNTSIFQHYIIQGIVLSFYSYLCLVKAFTERKYMFYFLSFLSFYNVLFMNDSRAAYILILILLLISFFMILKNKKLKITLLILIASLFFTQFSSNLIERVKVLEVDISLMENNNFNTSLGLRYIWAKVGINNIYQRPLIGYGAGSFENTSLNFYEKNNIISYSKYVTRNPHNEFISISTQLGFIGLILFIIFHYYLFKDSRNNLLNLGIATTVLVSSIFNSAFYDNMLGLFLVLIISILYKNKLKIKN